MLASKLGLICSGMFFLTERKRPVELSALKTTVDLANTSFQVLPYSSQNFLSPSPTPASPLLLNCNGLWIERSLAKITVLCFSSAYGREGRAVTRLETKTRQKGPSAEGASR